LARFGAPLKPVRVALLGCGTVGEGVVKLMRRNAALHERKLGAPLELVGVADRSLRPAPALGLTAKLITRDAAALVARADVDIVVELFMESSRALAHPEGARGGRDVVTANKAPPGTWRTDLPPRPGRGWRSVSRRGRRRRADHPHVREALAGIASARFEDRQRDATQSLR
jgi:predicted dinucleotide-utilizing enzyme